MRNLREGIALHTRPFYGDGRPDPKNAGPDGSTS